MHTSIHTPPAQSQLYKYKPSCIKTFTRVRKLLSSDNRMTYSHIKISLLCLSLSHCEIAKFQPLTQDITQTPCWRCAFDMCNCMFSLGSCRPPLCTLSTTGWCIVLLMHLYVEMVLGLWFERIYNTAQREAAWLAVLLYCECTVLTYFPSVNHILLYSVCILSFYKYIFSRSHVLRLTDQSVAFPADIMILLKPLLLV